MVVTARTGTSTSAHERACGHVKSHDAGGVGGTLAPAGRTAGRRPWRVRSHRRRTRRWSWWLAAGRLGLLFAAGAAPVLAIPVHVAGVLPLTISSRYVALPLALAAAALVAERSRQSGWAVR